VLVWEVIRNAEKNFGDDFDQVFDDSDTYKDPLYYGFKLRDSNDKRS